MKASDGVQSPDSLGGKLKSQGRQGAASRSHGGPQPSWPPSPETLPEPGTGGAQPGTVSGAWDALAPLAGGEARVWFGRDPSVPSRTYSAVPALSRSLGWGPPAVRPRVPRRRAGSAGQPPTSTPASLSPNGATRTLSAGISVSNAHGGSVTLSEAPQPVAPTPGRGSPLLPPAEGEEAAHA